MKAQPATIHENHTHIVVALSLYKMGKVKYLGNPHPA